MTAKREKSRFHLFLQKTLTGCWRLSTFSLIILLLLISTESFGQKRKDRVRLQSDTTGVIEVDTLKKKWSHPGKAAFYSAVLPGLGQIYNKKYWKLPIIYGGGVATGIWIKRQNNEYRSWRKDLFALVDGDSTTDVSTDRTTATESQLRRATDFYRKQRDLWIILSVGMYALQIVDAHVDAHLQEFDLSDDLSLKWEPFIKPEPFNYQNSPPKQMGVSMFLTFK
jgi:hypothetical protein